MIGWENFRPINGRCFKIVKSRRSNVSLSYYLDKIDLDNYWFYKATNTFRQIQKRRYRKIFWLYVFR